jgi:3-hydroxybutyryl-CoA dehydrogenase
MRKVTDIKNVLIIGSGTLGLRIGLRCALDGYQVKMYDLHQKQLDTALVFQDKILKNLIKVKQCTEEQAINAKKRIITTIDRIAAVADADLMSESVTENPDLKKKLYVEFAPLFESKTVLTTNTSYLLPSQFATESGAPDRFCAFHFHDVFHANVVDVMPHPHTASWVVDLLMDFGKTIHQTPVFIQNESPGYLYNAMLVALIGAGGDLKARDIGSIQDIDRSWMGNMKTNVGIFGMLDQIGLDTAWHVVSPRKDAKSVRFAAILKQYVDEGKLGVKTGEGFYKYPNPEFKNPNFL